MSTSLIFLCLGIVLWLMGLHGLLRLRHSIRRIMAINIMGSGTFMVMVALASRSEQSDPVLHALVVTGLVVAVSATAFALRLTAAIATNKHSRPGTPEPRE
ncbi:MULTISPECIES: NADH-quinone oxidoreductase subunit K [Pseudomonas]|uniref:NADH-quinone oxidoreductase subunit K n=1 Tax=Pseudomonas TaxID=286 RepID=UPI001239CB60|nr:MULTISPECIES: NADH-quinone oxidoreductase subunit K [Pseudomonas]QIB50969.1 NADH:quinone oxidoreductase [Pseudomonas sp. OIL-1]